MCNVHVVVVLPVKYHGAIVKKTPVHACPGEDYFVAQEIWHQSCPRCMETL